MPFDQHYLAAAIAPRYLYISSSSLDEWADPLSELKTCFAVSKFYKSQGKSGFICTKQPSVEDVFHDGCVGYHLREGLHYMGREDWQKFMNFAKKHFK